LLRGDAYFLEFHYDLSDRDVIREAQVNVAYRFFLDLSLDSPLPVPSLLSQFRTRLGVERFAKVFNEVLIADIAIPSTIQLVAQTRTQLRAEESSQNGAPATSQAQQEAFDQAPTLAHKVLQDREKNATDKLVSLVDPEARTGMHGGYFTGYLLDLSMDADSELICVVETLAGNGDEGADAKALIEAEERAHGNDVAGLSIDSAGFRGDLLHDLTAAERWSSGALSQATTSQDSVYAHRRSRQLQADRQTPEHSTALAARLKCGWQKVRDDNGGCGSSFYFRVFKQSHKLVASERQSPNVC
jgi:hypothetical protein